ncbi:hypothetical protein QO034_14750 [Sedimentitalea sp. JM2-8]|uniref:Uncharacterized protein n=1 Tax=Sedimentitalea xiamensis TaxID=3050037 RepID=A0ABT7FH97_9RHOB|nr:hypothetical protein [Sedimentitalea xiamensis]MDK3074360.1 hypothetical protein [Sedimentitalea xiamensis]
MGCAPTDLRAGADAPEIHGADKTSPDRAQADSGNAVSNDGIGETTAWPGPEHGPAGSPEAGRDGTSRPPDFHFAGNLPEPDRLRELVAEIVREELTGVLGDRIKQNMRKLVRREIHRVLTIQDLDPA